MKHCPFCGGSPTEPFYYDPADGYQGNNGFYIVKCSCCSAEVDGKTPEDAIKAWNKRVENKTDTQDFLFNRRNKNQ